MNLLKFCYSKEEEEELEKDDVALTKIKKLYQQRISTQRLLESLLMRMKLRILLPLHQPLYQPERRSLR